MSSTFRAKHLLPNAITFLSVVCGFLAVNAAAAGDFRRAVILIFVAGICDLLDGRVARLLDAGTPFGGELDSLCDAISFGIVPATVVYLAVLAPLGPVGAAVSVVYLVAGLFRLARFNLDKQKRSTFYGIPIPIGAGYMMSFVVLRDEVSPWWIVLGVLWTAGMMVSTVKVPNFKDRERTLPMVFLPIMIALFTLFLARPSAWTWHAWNGLNFLLVGLNYRMFARRPELRAVPSEPHHERAA